MRTGLALVAAGAALLAGAQGSRAQGERASGRFVIRDVRVFDGERVLERQHVLVAGGRIERMDGRAIDAPDTALVEGAGRTLLPGLVDSHVHVATDAASALGQALALGVTTMLDMYSGGDRLRAIKRVEQDDPPDVADVRTAGSGATAPGGHPTQMGGPAQIPTITDPADALAFVDARAAEGADYIKIIYDDLAWMSKPVPMLTRATLDALVDAAHRRGKLAVVHIGSEPHARDAMAAGADVLVHLFASASVSSDFGAAAARRRIAVIPTLSIVCADGGGKGLLDDPHLRPFIRPEWAKSLAIVWRRQSSCAGTEAAVAQLVRARVPILAGTDSPAPGTAYGASLHGELSRLVGAGLTPVQALAAATSVPARVFRLGNRGAIRAGMRADLLLVEGDPTRDITATRHIVAIWKRGIAVDRRAAP